VTSSLSVEVTPKRLEFLREAVPTAASIGLLINPTDPTAASQLASLRAMACATGLQLHILHAGTVGELEAVSGGLTPIAVATRDPASVGHLIEGPRRIR
jgi:putative ABC transport system substrate-binding protein